MIRINPVSDSQIEFHDSRLGSCTTAHSPEAATKILAGMGMTPADYLASVTPAVTVAPLGGFATKLLPAPKVDTVEAAQEHAERAASIFGPVA